MRKVLRLIFLCFFIVVPSIGQSLSNETGAGKIIPATYFGMHIHRADRGTAWPGREVGSWRLWDANVIWADLEPKPGEWDFSRLDRYLAMSELAGAEVLMPFGMTPEWASARPFEKGIYRQRGDAAEPRNLGDWERYISTLVKRYRGRLKNFELWNEVNPGTGFFTGNTQAMLALQKSMYLTIKSIDPSLVVVSPSGVGESEQQLAWFDQYLATGMADFADVISYHFYQPRKKPEAIVELTRKIRTLMIKNGAGSKPLWNTESGYRIGLGNKTVGAADPTWPVLEPQVAEAYVARALILGWWAGLERFYWYAWDNADLGFVSPDGTVSTVGQAYRTVARWMTGSRMNSCTDSAGIWVCELVGPTGRRWLIWNANDKEVSWSANFPRTHAIESLDGVQHPLPSDRRILIDGKPRMISQSLLPRPSSPSVIR